MSLPRKIKHTKNRIIDGVEYEIRAISELEYTGEWIDAGFDVYRDGLFISRFIGWPTDGDIRNRLTFIKSGLHWRYDSKNKR